MKFSELGLVEPILKALGEEGYDTPTPIQQEAIPHLLQGRDLLGCAQTGTGKTAAFAIPILQLLKAKSGTTTGRTRPIKALILTPTRELAIQIDESFGAYGRHMGLRHAVIFGGVGQKPQTDALQAGVDILTATPGRLLDLMQQGFVSLRDLDMFVLDEADRMLDMGFIHDVRKVIAKLPTERQTLFFSATMPAEIQKLANSILTNPVKVEVTPVSSTADTIDQVLYFVEKKDKKALLISLLQDPNIKSVLIFTRMKHGANKVAKDLNQYGIRAEAIHGNKSQSARQTALANFKSGKNRALVATDIAARGIDIDELSHVLNYELPNVPETYVHRIGRTGRAGASGRAISFCDAEERAYLRDIEKLIGKKVPVAVYDGPWVTVAKADTTDDDRPPRPERRNQPRQQQQPKPQQPKPAALAKPAAPASSEGGTLSASKKRRNRRRRSGADKSVENGQVQQPNAEARTPQAPKQQQPEGRREQRPQQQQPEGRREQRPQQQQLEGRREQRPQQQQPEGRREQRPQQPQGQRPAQSPKPQQQRPQQQQGQKLDKPQAPKQTEKKVSDWGDFDNFNW
jgi:ATP-dependent RNA helicase RhlE